MVTMSDLTSKLVSGEVLPTDLVTKALLKKCRKVRRKLKIEDTMYLLLELAVHVIHAYSIDILYMYLVVIYTCTL